MRVVVWVCPEHGSVPRPGPSGVCAVPRPKVVEAKYVCGLRVERHVVMVPGMRERARP